MATAKRKTVKSNPLDSLAGANKLAAAADSPAVKTARKTSVNKTTKPKVAIQTNNTAAAPEKDVKSTPVEQVIPPQKPEQSNKTSPSPETAEDILQREFSPATAMVVVPSALFNDDHLTSVHALHTVKSWSQWSVLAGLIPAPLVDTIAISGVQIKMIHDLCKVYDVEFKKEAAVAVVSGLVGGSLTTTAAGMGGVFLSNLPVIGSVMKYTAQPALSYASTYAIGRVFMRHFENNGTMLNLDSKKLAAYFKDQYAKGRKMFKYEFKSSPKVQSA